MDFTWLSSACDIVILVGAVFLAVDRILKPIIFVKKKSDDSFEGKVGEVLKKILPEILRTHHEETKEGLVQEIKQAVMAEIKEELTQVEILKQ